MKTYNKKTMVLNALLLVSLLMLTGCMKGFFMLGGHHYHR